MNRLIITRPENGRERIISACWTPVSNAKNVTLLTIGGHAQFLKPYDYECRVGDFLRVPLLTRIRLAVKRKKDEWKK